MVGRIELRADDPVWIDHLRVLPRADDHAVHVEIRIGNLTGRTCDVEVLADACGVGERNRHDPDVAKMRKPITAERYTALAFDYPMGKDMKTWDEFSPNCYHMEVVLDCAAGSSRSTIGFGVRDVTTQGRSFSINGTKTFMRGNVDCALMPKTGYAPMDVESWRKVWKAYKDFGLNMARFHSWCPPEAAFLAADEAGIYLAPEAGEWAQVVEPSQKAFLEKESMRILKTYGHHPSFVMMGLGNEGGGDLNYFSKLVDAWKAYDSSRLFTVKANRQNPPNIDYEVIRTQRDVSFRYQSGWPPRPLHTLLQTRPPQTSLDWREGVAMRSIPLIQHESAQFCSYPDIGRERAKYTGYLKASYLDIASDQLKERGMLDQVTDFVQASGKWQVELVREELEAVFRTPGFGGYNLLGLNDFTGQNTAPVGLTDAFYDPKPYVDPAQVRRWNGPTVLLARMEKRILEQRETFAAGIEVAHHGRDALVLDDLRATLRTADGTPLKAWTFPQKTFGQGNAQPIGSISIPLADIAAPGKLNLLVESPKNRLSSDWNIWVYPNEAAASLPQDVLVSREWDAKTKEQLRNGGTVLLLPKTVSLRGGLPICFTTYYWTSFGEMGGQSSACGILLDPAHPLFGDFPTENHANWQWWDLLTRCQPMILDSWDSTHPWPKTYRPLVQPIDSWKTNRKLALVAEAKVGKGKLLVCSVDIENNLQQRAATRQFRKSLFEYMASPFFNPGTEVDEETVGELFGGKHEADKWNLDNLPTEG